jgi:hypothetical protein
MTKTFALLLISVLLGSVMTVSGCETKTPVPANLPAIGSTRLVDGTKNIVVGVGNNPFEYVSKGESLILLSLDDEAYKAVFVPDAGVVVKVDPTKPSCLVGAVEKLNSDWPKGNYILVEYDQVNN